MYMNEEEPICLPLSMSSGTAMVEANELSLSAMINWLPNGGDGTLEGLGKDDSLHGLRAGHAQTSRRLHLTDVDRLDGAPEYFCNVGPVMKTKG